MALLILGAQLAFVGLADGQVRDTPEACERVSDLLIASHQIS